MGAWLSTEASARDSACASPSCRRGRDLQGKKIRGKKTEGGQEKTGGNGQNPRKCWGKFLIFITIFRERIFNVQKFGGIGNTNIWSLR